MRMKKLLLLSLMMVAMITTSMAAIDTTKEYRIKDTGTGKYLNAGNYQAHTDGPVGGVNVVAYAESDDQIFTISASGSNYTLKTKSGYNITITSKATDDENFIDCNENITAPFTDATKNSIVFLGLVCTKKDLNDDNFPENSISSPEILTGEIYLYSVNFTWEGKNGTSTSILNFLENNFNVIMAKMPMEKKNPI